MGNICNICHKRTLNDVDRAMKETSLDSKNNELRKTSKENNSKALDDSICDQSLELQIDINDFNIKRLLGKGSFGKVYLVEHKTTFKEYAMKMLVKNKLKENDLVENSKVERIILSKFNFPFIVDLKYSFQTKEKLFLVTEFIPGGDLFDLLKKKKIFSKRMIQLYVAEIFLCLEYLHKNKCIYRDLKPENILLSDDGHIKIIDFNLSKLFFKKNRLSSLRAESICGTADYMAPEIISQNDYNYLVDWYSLGVLTFVFHTGYTPFNCKANPLDVSLKKKDVYFNKDLFTKDSKDFISKLIEFNPKHRLGINGVKEIKNHPFFKGLDWDKVLNKEYQSEYVPECYSRLESFGDTQDTNIVSLLNPEEKKNLKANKGNTYEGFTYIKESDIIVT